MARKAKKGGRAKTPAARVYFHGGPSRHLAQLRQTMRLSPRATSGVLVHEARVWTDPMVGRVYMTPDLDEAIRYALGDGEGLGYVAVVEEKAIWPAQPDEDAVGIAVYAALSGRETGDRFGDIVLEKAYQPASGNGKQWFPTPSPLGLALRKAAELALTPSELAVTRGQAGPLSIAMQAKVGKKVLPWLDTTTARQLIDLGSAISVLGDVAIRELLVCSNHAFETFRRDRHGRRGGPAQALAALRALCQSIAQTKARLMAY